MENNIVYFSVTLEAAIILACMIFGSILAITKILPGKITRYGVLLLFNIAFLAFFYMAVNLGWGLVVNALLLPFVTGILTIGWLFYLFNTSWIGYKLKIEPWILILPILIFVTVGITEVLHYSMPQNLNVELFRIELTTYILTYGFPIFNGFIILLNAYKIIRAEKVQKDYFSSPEMVKNLRWSWVSLGGFTIFFLGIVFSGFVGDIASEFIFNFSILLLVLYLGYFEIQTIAQYLKVRGNVEMEPVSSPDKHSEDSRFPEIFGQVETLMENDKLYLNQDISISELSRILEVNSKYISQSINVGAGTNFNRYVNQKRVNQAVSLLQNSDFDKYTMEGIGAESGFRSKSSFNTAFRDIMGCTPTAYKKREA